MLACVVCSVGNVLSLSLFDRLLLLLLFVVIAIITSFALSLSLADFPFNRHTDTPVLIKQNKTRMNKTWFSLAFFYE